MKVYILRINDDMGEEKTLSLLKYIEESYRKKILKYRFFNDRKRSLYGHILSRYAIIRETGLKNEDIKILTTDYGKPYVKDRDDICYNVSHSGDYVACIIDTRSVGIDVQKMKEDDGKIAKRFFSPEENKVLDLTDREKRTSVFYEMWSLKEAYVKAVGKGLSIPLEEFSVLWEEDRYNLYVDGIKREEYLFKKYDISDDYKLSICYMSDNENEEIKEVFIGEITQILDSKLTV